MKALSRGEVTPAPAVLGALRIWGFKKVSDMVVNKGLKRKKVNTTRNTSQLHQFKLNLSCEFKYFTIASETDLKKLKHVQV